MTRRIQVQVFEGRVRATLPGSPWLHRRKTGHSWEAEVDFGARENLPGALEALLASPACPKRPRQVEIRLDRAFIQIRVLSDVPPVSPARLQRMVQLQASRFFRQNGTPLLTSCARVKSTGSEQTVLSAAVEAPLAECLVESVRRAGCVLAVLRPESPPQYRGLSFALNRETARSAMSHRRLVMAAVVPWLVLGGLYAGRVAIIRRSLITEREALRAPVEAILAARREAGMARAMVVAVGKDRRDRAMVVQTLAAVTQALPGSTWATSLDLAGQSVTIRGETIRPGAVQAAMRSDSLFSDIVMKLLPQDGAVPGPVPFELSFKVVR